MEYSGVPWFSYHGGHSGQFCRHATGDLEAVVQSAAEAGFTTYGLSEHCPRTRNEDLLPDETDLTPDDLIDLFDAYVAEATRLQSEWLGRLEILVGFETEAVPPAGWITRMRALRESVPSCDYVVGSVHHVAGHCIDSTPDATARVADALGGRESLHGAYFDLIAELAIELRPEVIGHFDLIRKFDGQGAHLRSSGSASDRAGVGSCPRGRLCARGERRAGTQRLWTCLSAAMDPGTCTRHGRPGNPERR